MKTKFIISLFLLLLVSCKTTPLNDPPPPPKSELEINKTTVTDTEQLTAPKIEEKIVYGDKFSIPLEANGYFYTKFECILDISKGKAKLVVDDPLFDCDWLVTFVNQERDKFQFKNTIKDLIDLGTLKFIKVTRFAVENYEPETMKLPMNYTPFKGDNSPYGKQACIFKVGEVLRELTTSMYSPECMLIDKITYEDESNPNSLNAKLNQIKLSEYKYIIIKDGVIDEYKLLKSSVTPRKYREISIKEIDSLLGKQKEIEGKYSLKVSLPKKGSNSYIRKIAIEHNVGFNTTQLNREVYKGTNSFGASKDVVKLTYSTNKLLLVSPYALLEEPKNDEQIDICFDSMGLKLTGDVSGRALNNFRNQGEVSLYGHFLEARDYKNSSQPTIAYPYETISKGKAARFQVEAIFQNGVELPLFRCSLTY